MVPVGEEMICNELTLKLDGQRYWLWIAMDKENRFVLATYLPTKRDGPAASILFRKAKEAAPGSPKIIRTDGLPSYVDSIKKLFPHTKHIVSKGMDDRETHNNISDRLQGAIRDHDKTHRGMQTRKTAQNFVDGWAVDCNFFRPHKSLGDKTPAEAADIERPFKNWREVAEQVVPIKEPVRPA